MFLNIDYGGSISKIELTNPEIEHLKQYFYLGNINTEDNWIISKVKTRIALITQFFELKINCIHMIVWI